MSDDYRSKPARNPRERLKISQRRDLKYRVKLWHYDDRYSGFSMRKIRGVYKNGAKDD